MKKFLIISAIALATLSAFCAGTKKFGKMKDSDWVVTNAWQAMQHRVKPDSEWATNHFGSVEFSNAVVKVKIPGGGGGIDTNTVDALANSAVVTNALTVATTNRVALLESLKADKSALEAHVANTDNPHAVTAAQVGAVPLVEDASGGKTAVTIGGRDSNNFVGFYSLANGLRLTASGSHSHAEGIGTTASGHYSHAEGIGTTASGAGSHTSGLNSQTLEGHDCAFAWNGDGTRQDPYISHGAGTFNINPAGGLNGFWIGEQTLYAILTNKANKADISATNTTFSNAVLAVGLNIDTNSVAVLNDIAATFGGFPLGAGETATTVGGLLAALAAAAAWLKKNKVGSFESVGGASATVENGVAKLDDFFTESNSLLAATIDARLPYPLYSVPSTGLLKDRAINTTSLASVTVPDNLSDLLIRASVASSLSVTMPAAIATKYGDTFPGEAGEYLITITKTGAAEAYVRTIKMEEVA